MRLNEEEQWRFIRVALNTEYPKRQFGLLLTLSGCRLSEGRGFQIGNLQAAAHKVSLRTLKRRNGMPTREVPVDPLLIRELLAIEERCKSYDFVWHKQGRKVPRTTAYRWIKEMMDVAEIGGVQASPKGLRHGFAARAILSGVPVTILQKWMGHASLETTMGYTALCGPEEMRVAQRMWLDRKIDQTGRVE